MESDKIQLESLRHLSELISSVCGTADKLVIDNQMLASNNAALIAQNLAHKASIVFLTSELETAGKHVDTLEHHKERLEATIYWMARQIRCDTCPIKTACDSDPNDVETTCAETFIKFMVPEEKTA